MDRRAWIDRLTASHEALDPVELVALAQLAPAG
jgi:hypothetical protein